APATQSVGWSTAAWVLMHLLLLAALTSGVLAFLQPPSVLPAAAPPKAIGSPILLWLARLFLLRYAILSFIAPVGLYLLGLWAMPQFTSSLYVVASHDASGQDSFDAWALAKIALLILPAAVWQTITAVLALRAACSRMQERFGVVPWPPGVGPGLD